MGGLISKKFQNGGQLPKYETTLSLKEEANFMPWLESQYKTGNITKGDFDFYKKIITVITTTLELLIKKD